tara:strand:+ start:516 stop:1226 length:711 start_codon:yes stop_codon:yes gene_type:complete
MISIKKLSNFEKKIGYYFKNKELLSQSLTHPSYLKDINKHQNNFNQFERFEFLGDRVLGLAVSSLLFDKYKIQNEGDLSKKYSYLVQKNFLYKISTDLSIDQILLYNFKKNNKKMIVSILSDSVESLLGAIFIDGGYKSAFSFVKKFWLSYLDIDIKKTLDSKTELQELSQQKLKQLPDYKLINKKGPPHSPLFTISLDVLNLKKIKASGSSIREAETKAATEALKIINEQKNIKN